MVEFTITGDELWNRMDRAVEKVNERLRKTVGILEAAKVPYGVIGGHAVRAWVAQVDEAALRTTRDVDILVRPADLPAMITAMTAAGFHHRNTSGPDMIALAMIDSSWPACYPEPLAQRLQTLLDDPDGWAGPHETTACRADAWRGRRRGRNGDSAAAGLWHRKTRWIVFSDTGKIRSARCLG